MEELKKMRKAASFILIVVAALFVQGCDNSIVKSIMKKMPWAKEEKVEKTELDIMREQLQSLESQFKEKEEELKSIKVEKKISDRVNKIDTLQVRWKCNSCGQITTMKSRCLYCGGRNFSKVEVGGIVNKEEAQVKNKRVGELQKEMQEVNIKIANTKDMIKLLEEKKK